MKLEDIWKTVEASSLEDWNHIPCWGAGSGPSYRQWFGAREYNVTDSQGNIQTNFNTAVDGPSDLLVFKDDVDLSIAYGVDRDPWWDGEEELRFGFQDRFMNKKIKATYVDIFWNGNLVDRCLQIVVDGGRCRLPMPDENGETYTVSRRELELARLINSVSYDQTDMYLGLSKFVVA